VSGKNGEELPASDPESEVEQSNRTAFALWHSLHEIGRHAIFKKHARTTSTEIAIDLLFVQALKALGSVKYLLVRGNGEDAATICRRLFELAIQVGYIVGDDAKAVERSKQYLAYRYVHARELADESDDTEMAENLRARFEEVAEFLPRTANGRIARNWHAKTIRDLTRELGVEDAYEEDYRFMSEIAHGAASGLMIEVADDGKMILESTAHATPILVWACAYFSTCLQHWNVIFNLAAEADVERVVGDVIRVKRVLLEKSQRASSPLQ